MSEPQKGSHADLYEIGLRIDEIAAQLKKCDLRTDGIFNNADAGFDAKSFRLALERYEIIANVCPNPRNGEPAEDYLFDEELYKERFVLTSSLRHPKRRDGKEGVAMSGVQGSVALFV